MYSFAQIFLPFMPINQESLLMVPVPNSALALSQMHIPQNALS